MYVFNTAREAFHLTDLNLASFLHDTAEIASLSVPVAGMADEDFVKSFIAHISSNRVQTYVARAWEGHFFSYLEQQNIPLIRSLQPAICNGALLCQPTSASGADRTMQAIDHDSEVVAIGTRIVSLHVDRCGRVLVGKLATPILALERPLQQKLLQLFIVYLSDSQEVLFLLRNSLICLISLNDGKGLEVQKYQYATYPALCDSKT